MKIWTKAVTCGLAALALSGVPAPAAGLATKPTLTLDVVKQLVAAAEKMAVANKWNMWIVVVDDGGNTQYVERLDEAQLGSFDVATAKARGALMFKRPTKEFEDQLTGGRTALLKIPNAMPVEGGVPLMADGKIIGAIGVSGGTSQQDGQVAKAGADALAAIAKK